MKTLFIVEGLGLYSYNYVIAEEGKFSEMGLKPRCENAIMTTAGRLA